MQLFANFAIQERLFDEKLFKLLLKSPKLINFIGLKKNLHACVWLDTRQSSKDGSIEQRNHIKVFLKEFARGEFKEFKLKATLLRKYATKILLVKLNENGTI